MSVLPKLMEGTWTEDQSVQLETSPQFYIQRARWKNSPEDVPLILDGEIKTVKYPLEINILPKALKVYRPK
jgi:diacylglycerol kinase family enzyme